MIWNKEKFVKEIKALLKLVGSGDELSMAELQNIRQKVLLSTRTETMSEVYRYSWTERKEQIMRYVISVLVGLSLFGGTAFASNSAKPGDLLYPVKRVKEKVQLSVAVSEQSKASLQAKFAEERLEELSELKIQSAAQATVASTSPVVTTTLAGKKEKNNDAEHVEADARVSAQADVNNALEALQKVKSKLEAKGNARAAAVIGDNIARLRINAEKQNLKIELEAGIHGRGGDEDERRWENSSSTPGTSTSTGKSKVEIKSENRAESRIIEKRSNSDDNEEEDGDDNNIITVSPVTATATVETSVNVGVKTYSLAEVQAANTGSKCWSIVSGSVYNLTSWISRHPGGQEAILSICGKDATAAFQDRHGGQARPTSELAGFKIGILK